MMVVSWDSFFCEFLSFIRVIRDTIVPLWICHQQALSALINVVRVLHRAAALTHAVLAVVLKVVIIRAHARSALVVLHSRVGHAVTTHTSIPVGVTLRPTLTTLIVLVAAVANLPAVHAVRRKVRTVERDAITARIELHARVRHVVAAHARVPRLVALCNALTTTILLQRAVTTTQAILAKVIKPGLPRVF